MKTLLICLSWVLLLIVLTTCKTNNTCHNYCSRLEKNKNDQIKLRLQQQWFANSGFAGELLAAAYTDSIEGIEIEVIPGSDQIDTKQVIMLGEAEFGVAGAEQIMQANEKGANLVVIGAINYKSLACFISKKEKAIMAPKDMLGHKIGTMEGTPVDMIYQVLKKKENLNIKKEDEIPTGWVLTGFIQDDYDVYPAFFNDEPVTLKLQGIDVNIIHPSYYGLNFIGTVYFCKRELVECCPEIVQSFINSIAKGWELTLEDPNLAITTLKKFDSNIDEKKERESLMSGLDYYKGEDGKILYVKEETWHNMADLLKEIGKINDFNYEYSVETKFVTWYLSKVQVENDKNAE